MITIIKQTFCFLRIWPLLIIYMVQKLMHTEGTRLWRQDLERMHTPMLQLLTYRLYYRELLYIRLNLPLSLARPLWGTYPISWDCPHIGGGLRLEHPFGTILSAAQIGDNLHVKHNVTFGEHHSQLPHIGNNVYVGTGACILGGVHIGDNVRIGANCVVTEDVPNNCIVQNTPIQINKRQS